MLGLASRMQMSAQSAVPSSSSISSSRSVYADKINLAYSVHTTNMENYRQQRAGFQVAGLQSAAWSAQISALMPVIGIGDLLGSDLGNLIVRPVARLIDEITGVAACIYDRASQALPAIRLAWADAFYLESDAADLHDLSVLPRWSELQYEQRREMQMLASWLFAQIDQAIPVAMQFMSDVVRVAILLASDAPVTEIIQGSSLAPAPLRIGGVDTRVAALGAHLSSDAGYPSPEWRTHCAWHRERSGRNRSGHQRHGDSEDRNLFTACRRHHSVRDPKHLDQQRQCRRISAFERQRDIAMMPAAAISDVSLRHVRKLRLAVSSAQAERRALRFWKSRCA